MPFLPIPNADLSGTARPSKRQSKERTTRVCSGKASAISRYQIVSAANRAVESITSTSVGESKSERYSGRPSCRPSAGLSIDRGVLKGQDRYYHGSNEWHVFCFYDHDDTTKGFRYPMNSGMKMPGNSTEVRDGREVCGKRSQ